MYNNLPFEHGSSLKLSHTSTHSSVNISTIFTTFPFQADQKHIVVEIEKEWKTVWEVFPELSANPGEPVTNPPSSPSTTQAIISSTTQKPLPHNQLPPILCTITVAATTANTPTTTHTISTIHTNATANTTITTNTSTQTNILIPFLMQLPIPSRFHPPT